MNKVCVSTRECNLYNDSYFYATYWNEGKIGIEEFEEVMIGSTAFAGGHYNEPITATDEVHERWANTWLSLKSSYDNRMSIRKGSIVYAPKARKYKSCGLVKGFMRDPYDSRESLALVEFNEGTTTMRVNKLTLVPEFIPSYLVSESKS